VGIIAAWVNGDSYHSLSRQAIIIPRGSFEAIVSLVLVGYGDGWSDDTSLIVLKPTLRKRMKTSCLSRKTLAPDGSNSILGVRLAFGEKNQHKTTTEFITLSRWLQLLYMY
jgi:hypothetical protein